MSLIGTFSPVRSWMLVSNANVAFLNSGEGKPFLRRRLVFPMASAKNGVPKHPVAPYLGRKASFAHQSAPQEICYAKQADYPECGRLGYDCIIILQDSVFSQVHIITPDY